MYSIHFYRIRKSFSDCLKALANYQRLLFFAYLKKDYLTKRIQYEKKLFKARMQLLKVFQAARKFKKDSLEEVVFLKIEHLAEIIFSLHQLRLRVDDYSVFIFCAPEMARLQQVITQLLLKASQCILKSHQWIAADILLDQIHAFEAIYNKTLQVISKEPIIFLFFIQDLYAFYDELLSLGVVHERT